MPMKNDACFGRALKPWDFATTALNGPLEPVPFVVRALGPARAGESR